MMDDGKKHLFKKFKKICGYLEIENNNHYCDHPRSGTMWCLIEKCPIKLNNNKKINTKKKTQR